eukprot:g5751.t1
MAMPLLKTRKQPQKARYSPSSRARQSFSFTPTMDDSSSEFSGDSEHSLSSPSSSGSSWMEDLVFIPPVAIPATITLNEFNRQISAASIQSGCAAPFICCLLLRQFCDRDLPADQALRHAACQHSHCRDHQGFFQQEARAVGLIGENGELLKEGQQLGTHVCVARGIKLDSMESLLRISFDNSKEGGTLLAEEAGIFA